MRTRAFQPLSALGLLGYPLNAQQALTPASLATSDLQAVALVRRLVRSALFACVVVLALIPAAMPSSAQDNVSEDQINASIGSDGSNNPIYFVASRNMFAPSDLTAVWLPDDWDTFYNNAWVPWYWSDGGSIVSAAYYLGRGLYLYAYEFDVAGVVSPDYPAWMPYALWPGSTVFSVARLTIPLNGHAPAPVSFSPSGVYYADTGPLDPSGYLYYQSVFSQFYNTLQGPFGFPDQYDNPAPSVSVRGDPASPDSILFQFPGTGAQALLWGPGVGPLGVIYGAPVFGFVTNVPPTVTTGQFAADYSGVSLPAFQLVVPGGVTMWDPVPQLLNGSAVTTDRETLATQGQLVQGLAADGVTEVLLRIPAWNAGDQFTLSIQNFVSTDNDGALGNPGDAQFSQGTVNVTAVTTNEGAMAFAIYRAPIDFPRSGGQDANSDHRIETIQFQPTPISPGSGTSASFYSNIAVARPPVVLVHGLWADSSSWDSFSPLYGPGGMGPDTRFTVYAADYSSPLGTDVSTTPMWETAILAKATTSSLGFGFNAPEVQLQIAEFINRFKAGQNPSATPLAAVQADIVAHSMGGDISRSMPLQPGRSSLNPDYFSPDTFGQGVIHKLITIGTPHLGSPLPSNFIDPNNACVAYVFAQRGMVALSSVTFTNGFVANGAMQDLQGDGSGGTMSNALQNLILAQLQIPTAMIAGVAKGTNLAGLDTSATAWLLKNVLCAGDPVAESLTSSGWPTIFANQGSDAVVPLSSQLNGLAGVPVNGLIHAASLETLGFLGPAELDPDSAGVSTQVINLLNTPLTNYPFYRQ